MIHPNAIVESSNIGDGTRIWAFVHILPGAIIGKDCNLCDGVFVENDVRIGDRVTIKCGVQVWDGVRIENDVFIGPNATFTNDAFPRSKQYPEQYLQTIVKQGASIGANLLFCRVQAPYAPPRYRFFGSFYANLFFSAMTNIISPSPTLNIRD